MLKNLQSPPLALFLSSNKCLTSSNKKLLVTSATLVVTSALLVGARTLHVPCHPTGPGCLGTPTQLLHGGGRPTLRLATRPLLSSHVWVE